MGENFGKKFAAIFSLSAIMYSAYVGPGFASGTQTVSYIIKVPSEFSLDLLLQEFYVLFLICFFLRSTEFTSRIPTEKPTILFTVPRDYSSFSEPLRNYR